MTKQERSQSLVNARRACLILVEFATGEADAVILNEDQREEIASLLEEFGRLDNKERKQAAEGVKGAKYGKKGGRPALKRHKKRTPNRAKQLKA